MDDILNLKFDMVIVGSGFAGSILARLFAEEKNKTVLLIEKRDHFGGNMYDYFDDGILVQKYGPHTFHTNKDHVYEFLQRFTKFVPYKLTYRAILKGVPVPCPFNFDSIKLLYPPSDAEILIDTLKTTYHDKEMVPIYELLESDNSIIKGYANLLFEEDFRPYTSKQWGKQPNEVDQSILKRVPIILNNRDTYFNDKYEAQPEKGFTSLMLEIIKHPNIKAIKNIDALNFITIDGNKIKFNQIELPIIYTGPLDALFGFEFGRLPYRSLHFKTKHIPVKDFQETAIVAYPKDEEFTRITEYTKLPIQEVGDRTFIAYEYPLEYNPNAEIGNEPFYPILTPDNLSLYQKYKEKAERIDNLIFLGRLADYRYYNMDEVIEHTLKLYEAIKDK